MSNSDKTTPSLTIDRAAFLLLRVKKAFRKKKQQRKDKSAVSGSSPSECNNKQQDNKSLARGNGGRPAPLLRSRTLPAIVVPGLSILQVQLDSQHLECGLDGTSGGTWRTSKRDSNVSYCGKLLAPRISFTDDSLGERRVSDTTGAHCRGDNAFARESSTRGKFNSYSLASSQPLSKLARLLNQRPSFTPSDELPRRLSWERKDRASSSSCLARSSSIDSLNSDWNCLALDAGQTATSANFLSAYRINSMVAGYDNSDQSIQKRTSSPSLAARSERLSLVSPSIGRKIKGQRTVLESQSSQAMEFLEGLGRRKALQRNFYQHGKVSSVNANPIAIQSSYDIHLHVLFAAVEQGYVDKVRAILESTEIEINSLNPDGLSTLDVAVLNNNRILAKMLINFGAQDGNQFKSAEGLRSHLSLLLSEAERRLQELGGSVCSSGFASGALLEPLSNHRGSFSSQHGNLTGCGGSAEEKQLASWERRARTLKKMLMVFEQTGIPEMPENVTVDVSGTSCVIVKFQQSDLADSAICTKFKLQWSFSPDFSEICGEKLLLDMKLKECRLENLQQGRKYYLRAAAGNLKGYSQFIATSPACFCPSSWRDVEGRTGRFDGCSEQLESLLCEVRGAEFCQQEGLAGLQRRNHKKKTTIKQLFTASSKFQKNLRRGVYLSCVLYNEDKILVTNEDFLPVIEIDESYPSSVQQDLHWLMKVACCWDDVKSLKQDMEKNQSGSTNHFRIKILQAATQMQAALCIQDLGQLYHKPVRDVHGTMVFSSVNHVRSSKLVSMLNSKWLPLGKIIKKLSVHEDSNVADVLMASIQEQVKYHQASSLKLPRGLYLGYFKLQSSVDSIQVVVPAKTPNVLPHCKVRDNPHVSAAEWQYLREMGPEDEQKQEDEQQRAFAEALGSAAKRLLSHMELGAEELLSHRIYSAEIVELSPEVSLAIVVPPFESACSPPGSRERLLKRGDFLSLPIQVFEMIHFGTYQREVSSRYFRLSCILELDTAQAQHSHREAFSTSELSLAKERLERLKRSQTQLNSVWKTARWLIDLITFARDKTSAGVCLKQLARLDRGGQHQQQQPQQLDQQQQQQSGNGGLKRSLLQLPPRDPKLVKSSPGRGSWPGPTAAADSTYSSDLSLLSAELSKSEQQLPGSESSAYSRKGSAASQCSAASEPCKPLRPAAPPRLGFGAHGPRLPPSKSEDVLALGKYRQVERAASAGSSPLLGALKPASESAQSVSSGDECQSAASTRCGSEGALPTPTLLPGILQVYAAYETGLASGTSLKLHVTPRTTAREVVDLVVKQLNMAVVLKGLEGPVYASDELANFCLVAVIGARERCLRDDFKPLQLQNPWKKGRLYVRQKQDVLAALEHSSKHSAYL